MSQTLVSKATSGGKPFRTTTYVSLQIRARKPLVTTVRQLPGDSRAAALHHQVCSWLDMLEHAGGDAEIAGLFAIFAAEGRDRMDEWWKNPTRT
jgi:hypothetical protein